MAQVPAHASSVVCYLLVLMSRFCFGVTARSHAAVLQADSADLDMLKKAVTKGQLKGKGIGCFVVQDGRTTFKQGSREECIAAKVRSFV